MAGVRKESILRQKELLPSQARARQYFNEDDEDGTQKTPRSEGINHSRCYAIVSLHSEIGRAHV